MRLRMKGPVDRVPRWVLLVVGCSSVIAGCAARSTTSMSDYDETGQPGSTYSVNASVVGKERARFDDALALVREGDYAGGIALLEAMHRDSGLDDSWRQEVLIQLGEIYGMPLNPRRDPAKAASYLEELLAQYPESVHAERARDLLKTYGMSRDD